MKYGFICVLLTITTLATAVSTGLSVMTYSMVKEHVDQYQYQLQVEYENRYFGLGKVIDSIKDSECMKEFEAWVEDNAA